ncbi:RraA family protein [Paraburkholderia bonniea]|uniref:RraA family protein n=1 Tax=Paraburkholderia bonniea TaxID=2152891 RepID=UPI0012916614|nr:RraA family protein [Paraburkholderia bonniea]WJF91923.1 RraA family protein [Paraburkholderia bonniea]WJF95242.1 RraA family protein [Paraburkholderia bonniea]
MQQQAQQDDYTRRLKRLDCCAVSDALDKLGLPGTVTGLPQRSGSQRIAGRAVTVKLVEAKAHAVALAAAPATNGAPRHLGTTAVEFAGPGDVIVVEQRTGLDAGSWGGILSLGASLRGIEGVIADGPVRDIDEARQYEFPVFARALTAFTARNRVAEAGTNVPVNVGSVSVQPGDYVIADNSAVIFIAAQEIERVLAAAEQIAGKEAAMAKKLLNGVPIAQVMGADYEYMLENHG